MFWKFPLEIQTLETETNTWSKVEFKSKNEFTAYCKLQFKEKPEDYKLKNTIRWQDEGMKYTKSVTQPNFLGGHYIDAIKGTHRWKEYWKNEKDKVLNGVIIDGIYLPPFYYWYLNFCPIYDDIKKKFKLPDPWDSDIWYFHYCMLCILLGKHIGGVKGRQKGYSYKHMAILYWAYCWFERTINTIGAYTEDLVKKSWAYLEGYRGHINAHTAWLRGPTVPKNLEWHETKLDADNNPKGLSSKLNGVTFKQNPFNDVGGAKTFFNYEEPGVSPTLLTTIETIRPALEKGSETTGIIIACGSVGELDDAEGIKAIFYHPEDYNFLPVKNIWDKKSNFDTCCIFISEAYNMNGVDDVTGRPFMDKDGNSDVALAMEWIGRIEEKIKNSSKKGELKQLMLSQKCTSPEQAFAERKVSEFPVALLRKQQERIALKWKENSWEYKPQKGLLEENDRGEVVLNTNNPPREHEYPIKPDWTDKRGVWTIYEPPDSNPEMFTYFAGVDAVETDVTETSESVASIDIFKTAIEVTYLDEKGRKQVRIEGDKLVANYRGRFDNIEKTNEQMWFGIKLYNAWTYAERNKPNFINYMRRMGKAERYLAKEKDVPLFNDINIKNNNTANNSKFGFHKGDNTEVWVYLKKYVKEYFSTEYSRKTFTKKDPRTKEEVEELLKVFTGIDRIDDHWLLEEFIQFVEGKGNYDRLISFLAALFICKIYQQNRFIKRRSEIKPIKSEEREQRSRAINMLGDSSFRPSYTQKKQKPYSML